MHRIQALKQPEQPAGYPATPRQAAPGYATRTIGQVMDLRRFGRPLNKRAEFRHGHFMNAVTVRTVSGEAAATIVNVSEGGMMLQCQCPPDQGEMVLVIVGGEEPLEGCVAWRRGSRFGVDLGGPTIDLVAIG